MERFSDKLNRIGRSVEASKTLAVTALAKRLKAEGRDVISLTAGEPDFSTPRLVQDAGVAAIREGATRYTAAAGEPALRSLVARVYGERWGVELGPENVCVSSGAKPLLYYLIAILVEPGEEVLFPVPFWVSYEAMVLMRGGVPRPIATDYANGHKLTAAGLDAAAGPKSKLLLLNNPTDPTGAVYSRRELAAIAEVARRPRSHPHRGRNLRGPGLRGGDAPVALQPERLDARAHHRRVGRLQELCDDGLADRLCHRRRGGDQGPGQLPEPGPVQSQPD